MSKTILIVEDEPKLASLLTDYLLHENFNSYCLSDGLGVLEWVKRYSPDLILMDVMLPNLDGLTLCRKIREFSSVPLFLITARIAESDRLHGLELGADDYICKPYSPKEVVARIKAMFRRQNNFSNEISQLSDLVLNNDNFQATYAGHLLNLTPGEYRILAKLMDKIGTIYTRATLLDCLYEDEREVCDRAIDSHIKNIRHKIQAVSNNKTVIVSVYGMGYKINLR